MYWPAYRPVDRELNRLQHGKSLIILTLEFQRIGDLVVLRKNDWIVTIAV
jgi:hypothetical protein